MFKFFRIAHAPVSMTKLRGPTLTCPVGILVIVTGPPRSSGRNGPTSLDH